MILDDIEHLPKVVTDIDGIRDVLLAIEPEIIQLRTDLSNLLKELYVKTTDLFMQKWEQDFGLSYGASLSLSQRRQRVLNKLLRKKVLNWENLKLLVKNNLAENTQFYIVNQASQYHFKILVVDADFTQLYQAINDAKPAYLTFDINLTEFFRRCGTFNCGNNPL